MELSCLTSEHRMRNLHSRSPQSILSLSPNQLTINKLFLRKCLTSYEEQRAAKPASQLYETRFWSKARKLFYKECYGIPIQLRSSHQFSLSLTNTSILTWIFNDAETRSETGWHIRSLDSFILWSHAQAACPTLLPDAETEAPCTLMVFIRRSIKIMGAQLNRFLPI